MVGSGPFRYVADERVPGSLNVYRKFESYVPRPGTTPAGWTAGPKLVHFDRVEWAYIPDPATTTNATLNGEAAWQEYAYADQLPLLRRGKNVTVAVNDKTGFVNMMRLNELQPPFDNPAIRRALWSALDQDAFMQAIVGDDASLIRNPLGFFGPGTPMASDAGLSALTAQRDPERAKQALREAGYSGETVLLMVPSTSPVLAAIGEVAADMLKRCGMTVEVYPVEFNAMLSRRVRKDKVADGGWSAYVTNWVGLDWLNPAVHISLRGNGEAAAPGWPTSAKIEELRTQWLAAPGLAAQQAICRQIQMQAFEDVPYYPVGAFLQPTAYRSDKITGLNEGFATFWNVRPV